jgi:hypothetical protein
MYSFLGKVFKMDLLKTSFLKDPSQKNKKKIKKKSVKIMLSKDLRAGEGS